MQLSKEHLDEFKEIYRKEFNKDISDKDAFVQAQNLITLIKMVMKNNKEE